FRSVGLRGAGLGGIGFRRIGLGGVALGGLLQLRAGLALHFQQLLGVGVVLLQERDALVGFLDRLRLGGSLVSRRSFGRGAIGLGAGLAALFHLGQLQLVLGRRGRRARFFG